MKNVNYIEAGSCNKNKQGRTVYDVTVLKLRTDMLPVIVKDHFKEALCG